jgi:hypothetical protein
MDALVPGVIGLCIGIILTWIGLRLRIREAARRAKMEAETERAVLLERIQSPGLGDGFNGLMTSLLVDIRPVDSEVGGGTTEANVLDNAHPNGLRAPPTREANTMTTTRQDTIVSMPEAADHADEEVDHAIRCIPWGDPVVRVS